MSKGKTLSYWQDEMSDTTNQTILLVRNTAQDPWMVVGVYSTKKADDIYHTTYAAWPKDCFEMIDLP
jgi:hypothetical protein